MSLVLGQFPITHLPNLSQLEECMARELEPLIWEQSALDLKFRWELLSKMFISTTGCS